MFLDCSEIYEEMFKEVPPEVILLMGYDLIKASGLVSDELMNTIETELSDELELGKDLEVNLDWQGITEE